MNTKEILDSFNSNQCMCGKVKKPKMSHCKSCYYKLPHEMRINLYKRFYEGYQEAFIESLKYLGLDNEVKNDGIKAMFDK
jgi:hypothetical protein